MNAKQRLKIALRRFILRKLPIKWEKKTPETLLANLLSGSSITPKKSPHSRTIEKISTDTNNAGAQPLWDGYASNNIAGSHRFPDDVRTQPAMGDFYTHLVRTFNPDIVVEFGTAFGVSGMYFLSGIESNNHGRLLTFEPNDVWSAIAEKNLSRISTKFVLTHGTFEENVGSVLGADEKIDIAFIDAIHTKEFVMPQLDIVVSRSRPGTIIILDDLNFGESMQECWNELAFDSRFSSIVSLGARVGLLELK